MNKETCSTLLKSILSFSFCFHKILWSSKCTSNMFILNFLDFLEVQVCLQEFFTDRKLFKSSFLDVSNYFAISCLQWILLYKLLRYCQTAVACIQSVGFDYWLEKSFLNNFRHLMLACNQLIAKRERWENIAVWSDLGDSGISKNHVFLPWDIS